MTVRYKVMSLLDDNNDTDIYDSTTIDWSNFKWDQGHFRHILSKFEILKFYLVSYQYYGTVIYEDAIALLNKIENTFDLQPEQIIFVPKLPELQDFLRDNSKL